MINIDLDNFTTCVNLLYAVPTHTDYDIAAQFEGRAGPCLRLAFTCKNRPLASQLHLTVRYIPWLLNCKCLLFITVSWEWHLIMCAGGAIIMKHYCAKPSAYMYLPKNSYDARSHAGTAASRRTTTKCTLSSELHVASSEAKPAIVAVCLLCKI